jgi:hypothetical protein
MTTQLADFFRRRARPNTHQLPRHRPRLKPQELSPAEWDEIARNIDARERYHRKGLDLCARDRVLMGAHDGLRRDRPVRIPEAELDVKPAPRLTATKQKRPVHSHTPSVRMRLTVSRVEKIRCNQGPSPNTETPITNIDPLRPDYCRKGSQHTIPPYHRQQTKGR